MRTEIYKTTINEYYDYDEKCVSKNTKIIVIKLKIGIKVQLIDGVKVFSCIINDARSYDDVVKKINCSIPTYENDFPDDVETYNVGEIYLRPNIIINFELDVLKKKIDKLKAEYNFLKESSIICKNQLVKIIDKNGFDDKKEKLYWEDDRNAQTELVIENEMAQFTTDYVEYNHIKILIVNIETEDKNEIEFNVGNKYQEVINVTVQVDDKDNLTFYTDIKK